MSAVPAAARGEPRPPTGTWLIAPITPTTGVPNCHRSGFGIRRRFTGAQWSTPILSWKPVNPCKYGGSPELNMPMGGRWPYLQWPCGGPDGCLYDPGAL